MVRVEKAETANNSGELISIRNAKTLRDGYMEYSLKPGEGRDEKLQLEMSFRPDAGGSARKTTLELDLEATSVDTMRYSRGGSTGNVGYHDAGAGAGVLALVGDKNKGLVALDLEGNKLVTGGDPAERELKTLKQLAADPKVRAFAKAGGLDLSKLSVSIDEVKISAAFEDKSLHTVALDLTLTDGRVTQKGEFSAHLRGDLARGLGALSMSRLEAGLASSAGWLYRPSDFPGSSDSFVRSGR
jgi:hypothetical protein